MMQVSSSDVLARATSREGRGEEQFIDGNHDILQRFTWQIVAINAHLETVRNCWAKDLGVTGPQYMIITALADLDRNDGVPVNAVAKLLHVDSSFITTQSKLLEKKGLVRRKTAAHDARIVNMSLTDKTYKHIQRRASQQENLSDRICGEFDTSEMIELLGKLSSLNKRTKRAGLRLAAEL